MAWLFVSLEAAIVAAADVQALDTKKAHWKKADVASEMFDSGALTTDFSDVLKVLNAARKAVFYEGEDPDLQGASLESIASTVESAIEQAEHLVASSAQPDGDDR